MLKIAIIGAGSVVFTRTLVVDILSFPALQESTIALMDIDPYRLQVAHDLVRAIIERRQLPARVEATLDRAAALSGAKYVIVTIQVGGLEAYEYDINIPKQFGVEQCVGDTLGPGGVFRGLRTIPVLLDMAREMDKLCPDALLLNYSNPMAINCWAFAKATGRPHVGLCHSVQGTSRLLASFIGAPYEEVSYKVAGINHQAWFLEFRWKGRDAYPLLRRAAEDPEVYGKEPVRFELMKHFGYFVTESSGHASEYNPYFRKNAQAVAELSARFKSPEDHWFDWGRTGGYLKHCKERLTDYLDEVKQQVRGEKPISFERSDEYAAYIINAMETNSPTVIHGNVPNTGLITNLPTGACVEVPCLVNGNGIQPTHVGDLPPQLAALNRTNINVQELAVEAALTGDRDLVRQAIKLDPLTAAVCTLDQIDAMVDKMFEAEAQWLPEFRS